VPHDYVPDARSATIMRDRSILWVGSVYRETWLICGTRRLLLLSEMRIWYMRVMLVVMICASTSFVACHWDDSWGSKAIHLQ
jgi:hypothetical protein